jgi:hypothetical protein
VSSHICQANKKFKPVPKPVSAITNFDDGGSCRQRSRKSLPLRNTWRDSAKPLSREK